jgi:hypothetical protein
MKTKKTTNLQKLALLLLAVFTVASFTGCRTSGGTGVKGHRGGIATGVKGTSRTIDPTSDYLGTRFEVWTVRGQIMPLNANINPDHYVIDVKDDWGPVTIAAIFPDGQVQKKTINWMINGVGVTAYVGGNAGLAAVFGIASIPSIAGDAISKAAYDLDLPRPHFTHLKTFGKPDQANTGVVYAPMPGRPTPNTQGLPIEQLQPAQPVRIVPTTITIHGSHFGGSSQNVETGVIRMNGAQGASAPKAKPATPSPSTATPTATNSALKVNSNPALTGMR